MDAFLTVLSPPCNALQNLLMLYLDLPFGFPKALKRPDNRSGTLSPNLGAG